MVTATRNTSDRKQEIVDVAVKLFLKRGVAQTSMRDLAKAIGVTTGSLYHHFRSKDEIIDFVVQRGAKSVDRLMEFRRNLGNVSPTEALRECLNYWLRHIHAARNYSVFWVREAHLIARSMYLQPIQKTTQDFINFFTDLINEGVKDGEFEVTNPALVAFNIWALAQEWGLRKWVRNMFTIDEFIEQQTGFIIKQISPGRVQANRMPYELGVNE
ncbi:MAG: TetR/AcrR family transcriptional regulator [Dehalococcoidia bacterium]|nr:TetR/AcrR family transcriptional regulator [Dehalococcoidia bacterium]